MRTNQMCNAPKQNQILTTFDMVKQ